MARLAHQLAAPWRYAAARLERPDARLWTLVPLALTAVVYGPLLQNYFRSDDFLNLFQMRNLPFVRYILTTHGGHILVTRNTIFFLFNAVFGTNPLPYFVCVLATHLLNVWLLGRIIRRLTGNAALACFGATLWGTSPVNAGALGWYAVYGHVLVATAVLAILAQVLDAAAAPAPPSRLRRALWFVLALAAATSFGVGMGMAMALPLVIVLLVPQWRTWSRPLPPLWSLVLVTPVLYLWISWLNAPPIDPAARAALPLEAQVAAAIRLLTTPALPAMLFHLISYAGERLVLGFFPQPEHYPSVVSYAIAIALLAISTGLMIAVRGSVRRQVLAAWVLVVGCYAMIAIGRVGFYNLYPSIEVMVAQARYHYAGTFPLAIVLCLALDRVGTWRWPGPRRGAAVLLIWIAATLFAYQRSAPFEHNQEARKETLFAVAWMRARIAQSPPGQPVYFVNRAFFSVPPIWVSAYEFPGWAGLFTIFFPDNIVDGRRVFFAEKEPSVIEMHQHGRRTDTLLVAPDKVPKLSPLTAPPAKPTQPAPASRALPKPPANFKGLPPKAPPRPAPAPTQPAAP